MSMITEKGIATLVLLTMFAAIPLIVSVLVMHFLMPKAILDRYWKTPHFRESELAAFSGSVFAPMRTVMFLWLFLFPRAGAKRQIENLSRLTPAWYRLAGVVIDVWVLLSAFVIFGIGTCLYLYWKISGVA